MSDWAWDATLYRGSARHYLHGRVAYPPELFATLAEALALTGQQRLLDVGCGPGSFTVPFARYFGSAVGVDADAEMLAEAGRLGADTTRWRQLRAEELPADLGMFDVVTFAQSFHWMDRPAVAATVRAMLNPGGACVHVHATTHEGVDTAEVLPHPRPPRSAIRELVVRYLGTDRRAGQGVRGVFVPGVEPEIYRGAGFRGPERIEVPGWVVTRSADDVVASVFSLSSSTPALFGDRAARFETDLRELLRDASPDGTFSEAMRDIAADIWAR